MTPLQQQLRQRNLDEDALVRAGISKDRARNLVEGDDPSISEIRLIARKYRIPLRSLIARLPDQIAGNIRLRQNFRTSFDREYESLDLLSRAATLSEVLPSSSEMRVRIDLPVEERNLQAAEKAASFCRSEIFGINNVDPVEDIEELIVVSTNLYVLITSQRKLEGSAIELGEHSFIALAERPSPRMRFTLAHEFGHYLFDLSEQSAAWFDEDAFSFQSGEIAVQERFANSFASSLLLPAQGIGGALTQFRSLHRNDGKNISDLEIMFLARFYDVSFQVAGRRLEDLELVPSGGTQALYENIRQRFQSPEVFADQMGLPRRQDHSWGVGTLKIVRLVRQAVIEGRVSIGRLSEIVELPIADLTEMAKN